MFGSKKSHCLTSGCRMRKPLVWWMGHLWWQDNLLFHGYEHPMAQNTVTANHVVHCRLARNATLKDGETLGAKFCFGSCFSPAQMRRVTAFLAYVESARARPYRPFPAL